MTELTPVCGISVVVPMHSGRLPLLGRLLTSVRRSAEALREPWECIVVDDSPTPESRAVEDVCREHGARYLRGPQRVGSKRNVGAAAAGYDILYFIDSDCVASEALLRAHGDALRAAPASVGGIVGMTEFFGKGSMVWDISERSQMWSSFQWPRRFVQVLWGPTVNLSIRRSAFRAVGGFEEDTWTVVGGEDIALGIRLTDAGWTLGTSREALVLHDREHVGLRQMLRRFRLYAEGELYVCALFPQRTRRHLSPMLIGSAVAVLGLAAGLATPLRWLLATPVLAIVAMQAHFWRMQRHVRRQAGRRRPQVNRPGWWPRLVLQLAWFPFIWRYDMALFTVAVRRRRPDLLNRRFDVTSTQGFVVRERPGRQGEQP
jgi:GT2 family glycosyltransferase